MRIKKLFSGMLAATAMLLTTSCTQEDFFVENNGGDTVSFSIELNDGASTRAINDGAKVNVLRMEVYDADGNVLPNLSQTIDPAFTGLRETVQVSLAKGQTYSFAFWAQCKDCTAYNSKDLTAITINNSKLTSNDDNRDAYFANKTITYDNTTPKQQTITLHRPFAQLNFAVDSADWNNIVDAGIEITGVKVKLNAAHRAFNALTGVASNPSSTTVTFKNAPVIYDGTDTCDSLVLDLGTGKIAYRWLAMNYVLVNDKENVDATFTFATNREDIVISSANTPLQRNYRTNLVGRLSTDGSFTVVIDPMPVNDINTNLETGETYGIINENTGASYKSIAEALAAAKEGDEISLVGGTYNVADGGSFETRAEGTPVLAIDRNVTLTAADGLTAADVVINGNMQIKKGTIKNLTISATDGGSLLTSAFYGDCLVENVVFNCPAEGTVNAFKEYSGWGDGKVYGLTFRNCTFNANGQRPLQFDIMNVTVEGCTFNNPYRYCVQLGEYARGCNLIFKNNTVENYGSTNKEFYTYVQICDQGNDKNNVVTLEGNTQDKSVAEKWKDYVVENTESNVKVIIADGVAVQNGAYSISNAAGLKWLATQVNAGDKFSKKIVRLANDIDLESKSFTPIGKSKLPFSGTFDGQGFTISNLLINRPYNSYTGLFGYTTDGEVKNLTIHNAEVKGYNAVGVVSGCPYTTKYNNITLTGLITVDAGSYVGGMFGHSLYASCSGLTINADEGSYINAESGEYRTYVGGIVGFVAEGKITISDATSNIPVTGSTIDVGGITGIAHYGNTFRNCSCSATVTVNNNSTEVGGIAGVWMNSNSGSVTFENCKFTGTLHAEGLTADDLKDNQITGSKYSPGSSAGELIIK